MLSNHFHCDIDYCFVFSVFLFVAFGCKLYNYIMVSMYRPQHQKHARKNSVEIFFPIAVTNFVVLIFHSCFKKHCVQSSHLLCCHINMFEVHTLNGKVSPNAWASSFCFLLTAKLRFCILS